MRSYWNSEKAQNWTGALVLAIAGALCVYLELDDSGWSNRLILQSALFALVALVFLLFVSPWSTNHRARLLALLWIELALICFLYVIVEISFVAIAGIVWIVQAAETFSIRITTWLLALMVTLFAASQIYHLGDDSLAVAISSSVTLGLFHLFAVITTHRANREQALREETAQLNRELVATRELLLQSSRQNERLRIARDLHDLLGHHLTALILNLEVATHLTEGKGQQKVEQSLALGKLLLGDLRTAVSELREDDSIDLQQAMQTLVQDTPHLQIALNLHAKEAHDVQIAETILRCTQESLTNCLRHSNATHCTITLHREDDTLTLMVQDNGEVITDVKAGNGLKGMSERVNDLGGKVNWHSGVQGFTLIVTLPVNNASRAENSCTSP
ncbi:MAG: sensor histidine kinase [Gammaproteobacteria bacterium]|nr:sensor histidine kinase [Gammaproteobacteria bacterium]MDP2141488.1 sensor histidine kinase [Gammaproteobacteria bacterium]MDP2347487.1 sensor histidine kinase [Gammaproteobacteria bacterium]